MHPTVIKTAELVLAGDLEGAERALANFADQEGDTALIALLDQVAPKDLLAMLREYDGARQSILNLVVTPKQFADAVVLETLYGEYSHARLRGMINAVLYREDADIEELHGVAKSSQTKLLQFLATNEDEDRMGTQD